MNDIVEVSPRLAILTSHDLRHRYFVNALADPFDVVAVIYQNTGYHPATVVQESPRARVPLVRDPLVRESLLAPSAAGIPSRPLPAHEITTPDAHLVRSHFEERTRQEQLFFGRRAAFREDSSTCVVRHRDVATLNTAETADLLDEQRVDVVAVYGTSLIKPPLLDRYAGRMINLHLGLSPYYRGTATNFYPLVNNEPQYVGATVHLLDRGIDSGPILHHARPTITADDRPHTLGCKALLAGIEAMIRSLREFAAGALRPVPQWSTPAGKLYLRKDYHPSDVVRLYERISAGLIRNYVAHPHLFPDPPRLVP